jgi:hypothetical protein
MKKHLLGASATLALALFSAAVPAAAACDPATHAVQYLAAKQLANGSIDGNINETADFVLGAASDGIDPKTLKSSGAKSPFDFFTADLAGGKSSLADANVLGKLIQAVVAGHLDPKAFGGLNLIDALLNGSTPAGTPRAYYNASTGAFLDDLSGGQNQAFAQANAILGLAAAADPGPPVPAKAITELKSLQGSTGAAKGGWQAFGAFDSNTTSMALMALSAGGSGANTSATIFGDAFTFIQGLQDPASGGFRSTAAFGPSSSDPQSDGLVIQALTAAGESPTALKWSNPKGNAVTDMLTFQDPTSGGFAFSHGQVADAFTTSGTVTGLRRAPFPVAGTYAAGALLPAAGCPGPVTAVQAAATPPPPGLPAAGHPAVHQPGTPGASWPLILVGLAVMATLGAEATRRRRRDRG